MPYIYKKTLNNTGNVMSALDIYDIMKLLHESFELW